MNAEEGGRSVALKSWVDEEGKGPSSRETGEKREKSTSIKKQ